MRLTADLDPARENLHAFLEGLPEACRPAARTLVHAWQHAGGQVVVGGLAIRMVEGPGGGPFTAATLYARRGGRPALELGRVVLEAHGLGQTAWDDWCDEHEELGAHGFDPDAKYPTIRLDGLTEGALLRLAVGLRDLRLAVAPA